MTIKRFLGLAAAVIISESAGVIGSVFTVPAIPFWYSGLVKPALNPPAWVFGPVWTVLYALMGVALFLISSFAWRKDDKQHSDILENVGMLRVKKIAIAVFFTQLFLNALWSVMFFGLRSPGAALVEMVFLWLMIFATIVLFAKVSQPAAWLLAPYIIWVSFAAYLNYAIWMLNR